MQTTINMCHNLGLEVVAEGVENEAIQKMLDELGVDFLQGYHLERPRDKVYILDWLERSGWNRYRGKSEPVGVPASTPGKANYS